jgi:hypothetical protein
MADAKSKGEGNAAADEKRQQRRIDKYRESESRWLQKVLFNLGKARHARDQLAEATTESLDPLVELDDGTVVDLDQLEDLVEQRVETLMDALGQQYRGGRRPIR